MKTLKTILFTSLAMFGLANEAKTQIISYDFYTFRLNNMYNVNAAYTSKKEGVNIFLNAQSQNSGVAFSNKNFSSGIYSRISDKQALGARINSDTRGAFQVLKADLSYAYRLKINEDQKLSFGLNMGILNSNLVTARIENFENLDQSDEMLYSPYFNTLQFTSGAGLLYTYKKIEVSVSAPNLISTNEKSTSYLNGAAFYTFDLNDAFTLTPWVAYQNIPITADLASLFVKTTYKKQLWLQVGYQSNHTFNAMAGVNIEQLAIGYGFKSSNNDFTAIASGTHEVSLKYTISRKAKSEYTTGSTQTLAEVVKSLNKFIDTPVTADNKETLMSQLSVINESLLRAEVDNSNPKKAKKVEKQLIIINNKLTILKQKLK